MVPSADPLHGGLRHRVDRDVTTRCDLGRIVRLVVYLMMIVTVVSVLGAKLTEGGGVSWADPEAARF